MELLPPVQFADVVARAAEAGVDLVEHTRVPDRFQQRVDRVDHVLDAADEHPTVRAGQHPTGRSRRQPQRGK